MKKIIKSVLFVVIILFVIDFYRFPEKYITTWKYQLEYKIQQGDQEAIDYYNRVYVQNNRILFE